jgi:hypothetical protein
MLQQRFILSLIANEFADVEGLLILPERSRRLYIFARGYIRPFGAMLPNVK